MAIKIHGASGLLGRRAAVVGVLSAAIVLAVVSVGIVNATIRNFSYTFNSTTLNDLLDDEFTKSTTGTDFSYSTNGGISDSGSINVTSRNALWTSKREFAVPAPGETYVISSYYRNYAGDGLGAIGFTTAAQNELVSGPWYPTPATGIGMAFHGGGGVVTNNGTSVSMPNWTGGDITNGWWYMRLEITAKAGNLFDTKFQLFPSDSDGVLGTMKTETTQLNISNPTVAGAEKLYAYFASTINRFDRVDSLEVTGTSVSPADNIVLSATNDRNGDGTVDTSQVNVATTTSTVSSVPITLEADSACTVASMSSTAHDSLPVDDTSFEYPHGFVDFSLNCGTPGFTAQISQYYEGVDPAGLVVRKFNPVTQAFSTIPGATITTTTVYGQSVTVLSYSVTDGGPLDDDGVVNGVIVDPAGLGQAAPVSSPGVPNTGVRPADATPAVLLGVGALVVILIIARHALVTRSARR